MIDDTELNAVIAEEREKMRKHLATLPKSEVERLKYDDSRGQLYRMIRDIEAIAEVMVRHPAIVDTDASFRYAMIIKLATRQLLIAENKSDMDDLWDAPHGDFSKTDINDHLKNR